MKQLRINELTIGVSTRTTVTRALVILGIVSFVFIAGCGGKTVSGVTVSPSEEGLETSTGLPAAPTAWTVTSSADDGDGSLRAVIAAAADGDQIVFDQSLQGQTIMLTSGELAITKSLDIEGLGAHDLAVSGNHASRIFAISGGVTVTIAGLTITDGQILGAVGGAGILNDGSTLTLAHDVLSHNQAFGVSTTNTFNGGAILNTSAATLTVTDSWFADNKVIGGPGENGFGGGISSLASSLTVSDSTFVGNQGIAGEGAVGSAGAIENIMAGATATISHCTFIAKSTSNDDCFGCGGENQTQALGDPTDAMETQGHAR